jgi:hypothetical protein
MTEMTSMTLYDAESGKFLQRAYMGKVSGFAVMDCHLSSSVISMEHKVMTKPTQPNLFDQTPAPSRQRLTRRRGQYQTAARIRVSTDPYSTRIKLSRAALELGLPAERVLRVRTLDARRKA